MKIPKKDLDLILKYAKILCPLCKETFRHKINIKNHIIRSHNVVDINMFVKKNL